MRFYEVTFLERLVFSGRIIRVVSFRLVRVGGFLGVVLRALFLIVVARVG